MISASGIEEGPYVTFGVLLNQYMKDVANGPDLKAKAILAEFLEEMANAIDDGVTQLLRTEIVPAILENQLIVDAYWPFLGARTRSLLKWIGPKVAPQIVLATSD